MHVYLTKVTVVSYENCVTVHKDVYLHGLKMDNEWSRYIGWIS